MIAPSSSMEKFLKSSSAGEKREGWENNEEQSPKCSAHIVLYCCMHKCSFCTVRHRADSSPLKSELVYTIPTYEVVPGLKETTWSKED